MTIETVCRPSSVGDYAAEIAAIEAALWELPLHGDPDEGAARRVSGTLRGFAIVGVLLGAMILIGPSAF